MSSKKNLYKTITVPPSRSYNSITEKMYRGFSTVNANTEHFALYDYELIKQDLLNHFHIRQGERLMQPTFGTVIWDLIFEPLTNDIRELIVQNVTQIINYDPRTRADQVIVSQYETGIQIECQLTYLQYNISEALRLRFDQSSGMVAA